MVDFYSKLADNYLDKYVPANSNENSRSKLKGYMPDKISK